MFQNIQAVRGIAALLVVLRHFLLVNRSSGDRSDLPGIFETLFPRRRPVGVVDCAA
jgi:peptidoglycan/LPS O-acetylase OafA/YrhL